MGVVTNLLLIKVVDNLVEIHLPWLPVPSCVNIMCAIIKLNEQDLILYIWSLKSCVQLKFSLLLLIHSPMSTVSEQLWSLDAILTECRGNKTASENSLNHMKIKFKVTNPELFEVIWGCLKNSETDYS